jgi:hypothetical protein
MMGCADTANGYNNINPRITLEEKWSFMADASSAFS